MNRVLKWAGSALMVLGGFLISGGAVAASVLDASTTGAVTTGLGTLVDTLKNLVGIFLPFLIGGVILIMLPRLILGLIQGDRVWYGGQFWDSDVYEAGLRDVKSSMRRGELVDAESRAAVRDWERGSKGGW
jgi:hypothetical protein